MATRLAAMFVAAVLAVGMVGCGGDAGVELSASDALLAVASQMQVAIGEYHDEVCRYDDTRESAAIAAFVVRVQADHDDASTMANHVSAFEEAMRKLRSDREVEYRRRSAAEENIAALTEVSRGLQKLALESLSLRDEVRRYLESWMAARQRVSGGKTEVTSEK